MPSTALTQQHPCRERASSHEASPLHRSQAHLLRREGSKVRCRTLQSCSLHPSINSQRALGCPTAQAAGSTQWYLHHSSFFHSSRLNLSRESISTVKNPYIRTIPGVQRREQQAETCFMADKAPRKGKKVCKGKVLQAKAKATTFIPVGVLVCTSGELQEWSAVTTPPPNKSL